VASADIYYGLWLAVTSQPNKSDMYDGVARVQYAYIEDDIVAQNILQYPKESFAKAL